MNSERLAGGPEVPPMGFFEACHSATQDRPEKNGGGARDLKSYDASTPELHMHFGRKDNEACFD